MIDQTRSAAQASTPQMRPTTPEQAAQAILDANRGRAGLDLGGVRRDLDRLQVREPELGAAAARVVDRALTPVQRGEFARAGYSLRAPDGDPISISPDGSTVAQLRAAPAGSGARLMYDRLDRVFGDGRLATDDTPAIGRGISRMIAGGLTLAQVEGGAAVTSAPTAARPDPARLRLDLLQMGLDLAGIVDPFGVADGTNVFISLGRAAGAAWSGNWGDAGGHVVNGGLSGLGLLPYLGDTAKVAKVATWARTVSDAVQAVAANPAARAALEPVLREVHRAVTALPQGAIDSLPAEARESLTRLTARLDEFFGAGQRALPPGPPPPAALPPAPPTSDPGRIFTVTPEGVAMSSDLLRLQGTSRLVGNFNGIAGATVEEIISRVPRDWTVVPQARGEGVRFLDASGAERLRLHAPAERAPAGSNSEAGWTARVHVPGAQNQYYDNLGNIVGPRANEGHIPIHGNPLAP